LSTRVDLSKLNQEELHRRERLTLDYGFAEGDTPPLPGITIWSQ